MNEALTRCLCWSHNVLFRVKEWMKRLKKTVLRFEIAIEKE